MEQTFTVGSIFHHSWGYDQTNATFYQVIKVTPKTVVVRKVANRREPQPASMTAYELPDPNNFIGPPIRKYPYLWQDRWHIPMGNAGAELWDGKPAFTSSYA